ncbi:GDSL-like Lipase/Acylhydrolase family protein [Sphingomonas laterariae]|uniref:GDSL-like Lipase/Acylhydrolase family protein n=1 Tax=Edaphosphingomonas laterariae TaxID=861865 RepID=A0A239JRY2_9SPHN|nr:GDSL-type esterase/lipase family protein [Sphingomonas laterariae]SNT08103.1 GDSL-like Lipase/Acylhydrolase family protein [Sphingomonas laterariae]
MMLPLIAFAAAAASSAPSCADGLCNIRGLEPFYEKLSRQPRNQPGKRPIHILQIGDSHTAGDTITGSWRELLQARYGGGGRGVLAAGRPYQGYLTRGVTADMSSGWKIAATFGGASVPPRPPMGISGFSLTSQQPGARIGLTADAGQMFDRFVLCAEAAPDAGTLTIRAGTRTERMALGSATQRTECRTVELDQPSFRVEVVADDRPVTITSWATFRDNGGVALSNVGVVGSQLQHFARTDDRVVAEELRAYKPDLIILAFGTNEGFSPIFRPNEYEITLRSQIGRIRRLAPGVPMLLFGAPDASSRRAAMLTNAPGQSPQPCAEPSIFTTMASASTPATPSPATAEAKVGTGRLDGLLSELGEEGDGSGDDVAPPPPAPAAQVPVTKTIWSVKNNPLFPPAGLRAVRDVQRRVAGQLGIAFWDWEARMGGACSAVKWVKANPPLMRGDYVHFNSAGGRDIAQRLNTDFERAHALLVAPR